MEITHNNNPTVQRSAELRLSEMQTTYIVVILVIIVFIMIQNYLFPPTKNCNFKYIYLEINLVEVPKLISK